MSPEQLVFAVSSVAFALTGVLITVRNWFYGGSVIRVELDLGRRDSMGGLVTGSVARWRDKDNAAVLVTRWGPQVDLVKVTVRNLGRTPATVHDVGMRGGRAPLPRTKWTIRPNLLIGPGVQDESVRIEAHDVKVFYFHALPVVRAAREEFGSGPLSFRAAVMTGTGKQRLSRRWRRGTWNVWITEQAGDRSITGQLFTSREQARLWVELTQEVYEPDTTWVRQVTDQATHLVASGTDRDTAYEQLSEFLQIFGLGKEDWRAHAFISALLDHLVKLRTEAGSVETAQQATIP